MLFISYQNTESENGQRINDRENEKKKKEIIMRQRKFFLLSFNLGFLYICKKKERK